MTVLPGHFRLYDRIDPDLTAGDYELVGEHELGGEGVPADGAATERLRAHLRVRSFRYALPPDQVLSTWPAADEEGAFEARLPQIVLRRRTLPWERSLAGAPEGTPWLALVLIAEGEGTLVSGRPVAECVTPPLRLDGPADAVAGAYLAVAETVVEKVFPTKEDLSLLSHGREVDVGDTELAMGDDDGFVAAILSNRLPLYDEENNRPVRYLACLISLEGQFDALPDPTPAPDFGFVARVADIGLRPQVVVAAAGPAKPDGPERERERARAVARAAGARDEVVADRVRDAMAVGFRIPIDLVAARLEERLLRFPVLAHWSFACTGSGSFGSAMAELDVGLLGEAPGRRARSPRPEEQDEVPPPPPSRPPPELAQGGQVGLDLLSRGGARSRAWYRGPFGPRPGERGEALAHVSEQLRRALPDGREDLGCAAAFEIGRLLALSRPTLVAALLRWRRERFGSARAEAKSALALAALVDTAAPRLLRTTRESGLAHLLGRGIVLAASADPAGVLAPSRPPADPGRPIEGAAEPLEQILARGFDLKATEIRRMLLGRPGGGGGR